MMESEATFGLGKYPGTSEVVLKNIIEDDHHESIMLLNDGKPVAFASLRLSADGGKLAHLNDVMVAPTLQGRGLGRRMVGLLLQRISELGFRGAYFEENAAMDFWTKVPEITMLHDNVAGFNIWVLAPEKLDKNLLVDRESMNLIADEQ